MVNILIRACSFIALIVAGYMLKKIGFFKKEDFGILSKVAIRLTLPCAIIVSFNGKVIDPALLSLPLIALAFGSLYVLAAYLTHRNMDREKTAFAMVNAAGYNIGNFVIPFAQSFFGPMAVIAISIFDTGNGQGRKPFFLHAYSARAQQVRAVCRLYHCADDGAAQDSYACLCPVCCGDWQQCERVHGDVDDRRGL